MKGDLFKFPLDLRGLRQPCAHQGLILQENFLLTLFRWGAFCALTHSSVNYQASHFWENLLSSSLQVLPLKRPKKWERVVTFSSPSIKSFTFAVEGGQTIELAIAQFWSSGIGSHEITTVDFEVWWKKNHVFLSFLYS